MQGAVLSLVVLACFVVAALVITFMVRSQLQTAWIPLVVPGLLIVAVPMIRRR